MPCLWDVVKNLYKCVLPWYPEARAESARLPPLIERSMQACEVFKRPWIVLRSLMPFVEKQGGELH
jgi:hypothetical protein